MLCFGVSAVLPMNAAYAQDVPVVLNDTGEDACGTGQIVGLNPKGDGFLAVRSGPGKGFAQIDKLHNADRVAICDSDGDWIGIVYGKEECTYSSPVGETQNGPYSGPCRSGWVFGRYVELIAG
jgi:hypothetical protein